MISTKAVGGLPFFSLSLKSWAPHGGGATHGYWFDGERVAQPGF